MKLRVLSPFEDFEANLVRQVGDVFEVSKERLASLSSRVPPDFYEVVKSSKTKDKEE
ncbi:TPA: hypothetical protein U1364_000596 [Streptococcus suis]|nr:hypothetical protein [Streptococcus suis]HEM5239282.1 hypothetical protein [Streptococcus suis]HEM5312215.1 hypothetical protein [Streptococcus suis]